MKKFVIFLFCFYPIVMFCAFGQAIYQDIDGALSVARDMNVYVNAANNYCVKATQDIEGLQDRIISNPTSRSEYLNWIRAMQNMQAITFGRKGNITYSGTVGTIDSVFRDRYLKKLDEEARSNPDDIMTPLNFSITFLDRQQLAEDAKWYMYQKIRDLNDRFRANEYGLYRIDPMTLDVEVSVTATPINLLDNSANPAVRQNYLKLFGSTMPSYSNLGNEGITSKADRVMSNVIVKYDIIYYVYYDYIPTSFFFRTNNKNIGHLNTSDKVPPKAVYYPFWFDKDGNVNPNKENRVAMPRMKFTPADYIEFKYSYILTN